MPRKSGRLIFWLGVALLVLGLGCALLWSAFASLYVPECPTFALTSNNPHCARPVLWIYVGYACAALGTSMVASFALMRRRVK